MRAFTAAALNNSRFTLATCLLLVLTGTATYFSLPSREDPEIIIRTAAVTVQFPGMSPERVEQLLAEPLETAIKEMPEVEDITTVVQTGLAIVRPEVSDRYSDLAPIWQELRNKMDDVSKQLPAGTYGPYVDDDVGSVAAATLVLQGDEYSDAELGHLAEDIADSIATLPLVASTDRYGVQDERIWLDINQDLIAQYGLNPNQLMSLLQTQNVVSPGGRFSVEGQSFTLEPSGSFESLEDIRHLPIEIPGHTGLLYLQDVATIYRGYVDPVTAPVLYNGRRAIAIAVEAISHTNTQMFGRQLTAELNRLRLTLPVGVNLDVATYQPRLVAEAVNNATSNLLQTVAIVLVVVMLFLGMRTGMIVGAIVPMTMMMAMLGMAVWGIELHRTSIAAIIISLGLLVDNGIVVAEEISRRFRQGQDRREAVLDAVSELAWPLLSSSLTTILAFVPLILAQNTSGEFLRSLAQVIIIALLSSWLLATIVIPCFCMWLLKDELEDESGQAAAGKLQSVYKGLLQWVIRQRLLFVGSMVALLMVAVFAFQYVPKQFMSASDRPQFMVYLDLPAGTRIEETLAATQQLSRWLSDSEANPDVTGNIAYVDSGGPRFYLALSPPDPASYRSYLVVNTDSFENVEAVMRRVDEYLREELPWVRGRSDQLYMGPSSIGTVELRISGPELEPLKNLSLQLQDIFRTVPGTRDIRDDWDNPILKFKVEIDQELARRAGVSSDAIASSLSSLIDGVQVTDYREGEDVIPVMLRADDQASDRIDKLGTLNVMSSESSVPIPLLQVARIVGEVELPQIRRRNQVRTVTVYARHPAMQAAELYSQAEADLTVLDLPEGYHLTLGGELESSSQANSALFEYLPHCLLLIVLLLILQFNSVRRPVIILATIPLILIGAVGGLLISGVNFSFTGMLGLFSLAGIIVNNGIVLTNKVDAEREAGADVGTALVTACLTRFRPILMTTLTTILGLIPLILFGGEFWIAMGVVIVAGLAVGSLLTLLFVPALYSLLFDTALARWFDGRFDGPEPEVSR